jgi:hypothetical protein
LFSASQNVVLLISKKNVIFVPDAKNKEGFGEVNNL